VDGVYSADPRVNKSAKKYSQLTYKEALEKHLEVMDQTAFALAQEGGLKILVFKFEQGSLVGILRDESKGTIIYP
jgi:uridylate kinase